MTFRATIFPPAAEWQGISPGQPDQPIEPPAPLVTPIWKHCPRCGCYLYATLVEGADVLLCANPVCLHIENVKENK